MVIGLSEANGTTTYLILILLASQHRASIVVQDNRYRWRLFTKEVDQASW